MNRTAFLAALAVLTLIAMVVLLIRVWAAKSVYEELCAERGGVAIESRNGDNHCLRRETLIDMES